MKRSALYSLASLAMFAAMALVCAVEAFPERCHRAYMAAKGWLISFTLDAVATIAGTEPTQERPALRLVQAKAFVQRLVRRDRPQVTNSWRMIPSV